ncbi:MAG: hypothetical protein IIZ28_06130 [Erysipelotrichaceae bacterium]|nr:hypothetical protein [Erysipelotrichaceae bacterium]
MKKMLLLVLSVLFLSSLMGCTKKEEDTKTYDIAGKTYYDTSDLHKVPSRVWFGKDGSFVLTDEFAEGLDEMSGSYEVKEDVITLNVDAGSGKYKKILFEYKNGENIVLRTSLQGSKNDALYSIHEPEVQISENTTPAETKTETGTAGYKTFFNASQKKGVSYLILYDDGSFTLNETNGSETVLVKGLYGKEGDVYMFSNFDSFKGGDGSLVSNFEFRIMNEDTLILQEDLCASSAYDVFSTDGTVPVTVAAEEDPFKDVFKTTTWTHEEMEGILKQYLPSVTIATDYSFKFIENCYSGMGEYTGYCQKTDKGWACDVLDASKMQGFKGDEVKTIVFEENKDGDLILKTELCMSMPGEIFKK